MDDTAYEPKTAATTPGVLLAAASALAFVISVVAFSLQQIGVGVGAASIALLLTGGALSWLSAEARRVRDAERIAH